MRKTAIIGLLIALFMSQMSTVFADTVVDRDTAVELAIENSDSKESLEDTLTSTHAQMASLYRYAKSQEDGKENYDAMVSLMKSLNMTISDEMVYTAEQSYNYFYSMQIQYESVNAQYLALKDTVDTIDLQLEAGVDTLLTNLLYLNEVITLQDNYVDIQTELMADADTQYALGMLSENDYADTKAAYLKSIYQRKQTYYSQQNLELQLKQMLGLAYNESITLEDDYLSPNANIETLEYYETLAAENRNDIKSAEYSLEAAENIYDYNMSALYDLMNQFKAQMAIDQAEAALEEVKISVYNDVSGAYQDVLSAETEMKIAQKEYEVQLTSLRQAKISYEQGLIKDTDLALVQYATDMSQASVKSSIRSLYLAIETLNNKTVIN